MMADEIKQLKEGIGKYLTEHCLLDFFQLLKDICVVEGTMWKGLHNAFSKAKEEAEK